KVEMPEDGPIVFEVEVEVKPEIALPDYQNVELEVRKIQVADSDVEEARNNLLRSRGRFVEQDKKVKIAERDMLTADIQITCGKETIHEQTDGTLAVFPQSVGGIRLDMLVDELSGKKAGDTVTLKVEVPEDHEKADLVGKEAEVTIAIKSVRRLETPELTDEFAKGMGFESAADVDAELRKRLEADVEDIRVRARREAMGTWLIEHVEFEVPEGVAKANAGRVFNQHIVDLQRRGVPVERIEERAEELREASDRQAQRQLKLDFICEAAAKAEKLEVTEDEIQARVSMIAAGYGRPADRLYAELEKRGMLDAIRDQIRDDKVFALLLEKAKVTEVEAPAEEAKEGEAGEEKPKKKSTSRKAPAKSKAKKTKDAGDDESKDKQQSDDETT
ncbi:MAG: trigger factor, partial [Planctomycetes bacterium]|nr:trigger factor [Planctomycetota bacterium]